MLLDWKISHFLLVWNAGWCLLIAHPRYTFLNRDDSKSFTWNRWTKSNFNFRKTLRCDQVSLSRCWKVIFRMIADDSWLKTCSFKNCSIADRPDSEVDELEMIPLTDRSCQSTILGKVFEYLSKHHDFDATSSTQRQREDWDQNFIQVSLSKNINASINISKRNYYCCGVPLIAISQITVFLARISAPNF